MRIYCPLKPGTIIELRQDEEVYHGEIRYCVPDGADFRIGVMLVPPDQWTPDKSWPILRDDAPPESGNQA